MKLSRRALLGGIAASAALPGAAVGRSADRKLVVVVASGGWDVSFGLDPKPGLSTVDGPGALGGAALERLSTFGGIEVATNEERRPAVARFFERWADRTAVINGISVGTLSHTRSLARVLSGHWDERHPDLTAVVGASGGSLPLGTIDLCGLGRFGPYAGTSARWGRQGQARALLDPTARFSNPDLPDGEPWIEPDRAERRAVDAWLAQRAGALGARWEAGRDAVDAWIETRQRAIALRDARPAVGAGLPWGWEASYQGDTDLVVDLLGRNLCRAILVSTRQSWDTHADHDVQHTSWNRTFYALDRLITGLSDSGQLDSTTVVLLSEMTRTPRLNLQGGKDHWPWTSWLVCGAGIRGGVQLGGTDELLRGAAVDPESGQRDPTGRDLEPAMVLAGIAEVVGLDPGLAYPGTPVCRGFAA